MAGVGQQEFDQYLDILDKGLTSATSVRGTMFKHASFGRRSEDAEWDVEYLGDPATIFIRSRASLLDAGDNLDTLHPAGSGYDYFLLGARFGSIAHTPWVKVPSVYKSPLNVCLVTGYQQVCDMEDALRFTLKSGIPVTQRVEHNEDGTTTLVAGVTLSSMLKDNFLLNVPPDIQKQFTPTMLRYQLSARFVLDRSGRLEIAQISGTVPGPTPFTVQVGYQVTGSAATSDLPQVPPAAQVTTLSAKVFNAAVARIKDSPK